MTLDDIECQDSTDIYACAEVLGFGQDDGWDDARARALLLKIRRVRVALRILIMTIHQLMSFEMC